MFNQLKKKIQGIDIKWRIGGLIGIAAVAGLLYFQFGKPHETPKTEPKKGVVKTRPTIKSEKEGEQSPEKNLVRVINKLKSIIIQGDRVLNAEQLKAIFLSQYELSRKSFIKLTKKHRAERRALIADLQKYRQISIQYDDDIEKLNNDQLNAILAHFHIDKQIWMQNINIFSENQEQWSALLNEAEQDNLKSLRDKDKPKVSLGILIDIFKFKTQFIKNNTEMYKAVPHKDETELHSIVEKHLQDKVFEKFKVEEEDIQYSIEQLNEEDSEKLENHKEEYTEVLGDLIYSQQEEDNASAQYQGGDENDNS